MSAEVLAAAAGSTLSWAALSDVCARRIPNHTVVALAALALPWHLATGTPPGTLGLTALLAALAFAGAAVLWRRGLVGGGDVKFLAATLLVARPGQVPEVLLTVALAGGLLAAAVLARRTLAAHPFVLLAASHPRLPAAVARALTGCSENSASVPYGVAIAAGGFVALAGGLSAA